MDNFKLASKLKLRIQTSKGLLSPEQLWDLSIDDLDALAVSLDNQHKDSGKKSFIGKSSEKDKTVKLRFDIVLEVLNTKSEDAQVASEALEIKQHNEKIISLIVDKQDESLKKKSVKQLQEMLR